ncbi:MAG TPA: glycosyl hydrolase family 17 protein [Gemmataceae bacterium]|nr:glycosyl hydrolase family 17 protein [Gemmataceae bacterium]
MRKQTAARVRLQVECLEERSLLSLAGPATIGTFAPSTATWYLKNSNQAGAPDVAPFAYGAPSWRAVVGDWDGDGISTIGVFDPATATWYLRNSNTPGAPDIAPFAYGAPGWLPVVGDWNGDGIWTVGVVDPATETWYLRDSNTAGAPSSAPFAYGAPGWAPVVGDWNGDGSTTPGVFDPSAAAWYLRNSTAPGAPDVAPFAYGAPGWLPIVGDWNGDGRTGIGVVDPTTENWYLRNSTAPGAPDLAPFAYGAPAWGVVAGLWVGRGSTPPAISYRLPYLNFSPYIHPGEDPNRGPGQISAEALRQDLAAVAPYTEGIRTFGCTGDLQPVGQIAHSLGLRTAIGAWISTDPTANQAEIDSLVTQALQGNVDVAIVGSEALLRGDVSEATLISYITQVQTRIHASRPDIPVTTSDTYNVLEQHPNILAQVDVVYANFYPFWEQIALGAAISDLSGKYQHLAGLVPGKQVIVSETGWPSQGSAHGAAVPSLANAATYFHDFVVWALANQVTYNYFEAYDEPWKISVEGDVGPYWGLFVVGAGLKPGMGVVFTIRA